MKLLKKVEPIARLRIKLNADGWIEIMVLDKGSVPPEEELFVVAIFETVAALPGLVVLNLYF